MKGNKCIKCDVVSCVHNNVEECNCKLNGIKVCCDGDSGKCTCCGNFECK